MMLFGVGGDGGRRRNLAYPWRERPGCYVDALNVVLFLRMAVKTCVSRYLEEKKALQLIQQARRGWAMWQQQRASGFFQGGNSEASQKVQQMPRVFPLAEVSLPRKMGECEGRKCRRTI